jgi:hypothetical protein
VRDSEEIGLRFTVQGWKSMNISHSVDIAEEPTVESLNL